MLLLRLGLFPPPTLPPGFKRQRLEWLYRKTGLTVHHVSLIDHLNTFKIALNSARSNCVSSTRPKVLFNTINKLIHPPAHDFHASDELCCSFLNYFQEKLNAIRQCFLNEASDLRFIPDYSSVFVQFYSSSISDLILKSNS